MSAPYENPTLHARLLLSLSISASDPPCLLNCCMQSLSVPVMADLNLLYLGLVIPTANVSFFLLLPSFDVTKRNWPAFFAFLSSCGVSAAGLPAIYSLLQWVLSTPALL